MRRTCWAAALVIVAVAAATARSQSPSYRLVPGWAPAPGGAPSWGQVPGLTIDAMGRIIVFRRQEPPIVELDSDGHVLKTWGENTFIWPHGMRVDRDGFLWITDGRARDGRGQQVFKYRRDGTLMMTLGRAGESGEGPDVFNGPCDVAVAENGDIFVADGHWNARIVKFSKDGRFIKTWGGNTFIWPHGMRVDRDGFLWITDGRARDGRGQQVFKYRRDGTLVMTLGRAGESGEGPDVFNGPCDVAVAENGDIFVADGHWNARILKFSNDGRFIKAWGRKGTGPGEFDVPHALVIDKRGRLLVGDRTNKRVQVFDQDGRFLDQWTHLGSPSGMFIAPDDTLFVVDYNDRKGIFIASAETGELRQKLDDAVAESVAVGADGAIYVGETVPGETLTGLAGGNLVRKFVRQP